MKKKDFSLVIFKYRWILFWVVLFFVSGCTATGKPSAVPPDISESLGIEVVAIRRSADGYMLDFRYRVLDGSRAAVMTDHKVKPYLVHEATGARFAIPSSAKVGPLRQAQRNAPPQEGRIYFMMFANPGRYAQVGDLVTVIVGDVRIEHLVVE